MSQEILRQRTWNAGELDPDLLGRDDVKVSANGAKWIENCLCVPQGPLQRRPGQTLVDVARHPMTAIDASGATWTAPNGGTAADAKTAGGASLLTTADVGATDGYVIVQIEFDAPVSVSAIDLVDFGLHDTGADTPPTSPPIHYPWGVDLRLGGLGGGFFNLP